MATFDKIIQKLTASIQNLSANGDNKNGKIDTTNEKNELAKLLAGAEQEVGDLFSQKMEELDEQGEISVNNYRKQRGQLVNERESAISKMRELVIKAFGSLKKYETATLNVHDGREVAAVDRDTYDQVMKLDGRNAIKIEGVRQNGYIFKDRPDGSYEERLSEQNKSFNVVIRDKDGNEISRKSYTKSKKGIYTNKETVAKNCGLLTKNNIDDFKTGFLGRAAMKIFMSGKLREEDVILANLNKLDDNGAINPDSGFIYKWNPKTNEYEKVGEFAFPQITKGDIIIEVDLSKQETLRRIERAI